MFFICRAYIYVGLLSKCTNSTFRRLELKFTYIYIIFFLQKSSKLEVENQSVSLASDIAAMFFSAPKSGNPCFSSKSTKIYTVLHLASCVGTTRTIHSLCWRYIYKWIFSILMTNMILTWKQWWNYIHVLIVQFQHSLLASSRPYAWLYNYNVGALEFVPGFAREAKRIFGL